MKLQVIPSSTQRLGQTSERHVFPVTLKSAAVFVLVTTAMQVGALMTLEEQVLAKHCPCLRAMAGLAPAMPPQRAYWAVDVSAETSGKKLMTGEKQLLQD